MPNQAARSLVTQRTDSIALVVSGAATRVFSDDPFFAGDHPGRQPGAGGGRQAARADAGRLAGRATTGSSATPPAGTSTACMFASLHGADPLPGTLAGAGVPVVCGGRPVGAQRPSRTSTWTTWAAPGRRSSTCSTSAAGGSPPSPGRRTWSPGIDRLSRLPRRAARRRPPPSSSRSATSPASPARRRCAQLLRRRPDARRGLRRLRPDGARRAAGARGAGRRVPDDVAVVGFDDIHGRGYTEPPLTTVRQPTVEMGRRLARMVLDLEEKAQLVLPTELVVRESTKKS